MSSFANLLYCSSTYLCVPFRMLHCNFFICVFFSFFDISSNTFMCLVLHALVLFFALFVFPVMFFFSISDIFILVLKLVDPISFILAVLYPDEEFVNQIRKLE